MVMALISVVELGTLALHASLTLQLVAAAAMTMALIVMATRNVRLLLSPLSFPIII